ncbi:MAG: IlvD/Edd family dehydratase [Pseudomonadota bacterium]
MNKVRTLRSQAWLDDSADPAQTAIYLERFLNYGLTPEELQSGRPVIGIAQTGSDLTPCNRHHIQLAQRVREGIRDAGGIPMEFPVHPIAEQGRRPTAALDRNLAFLGLIEILHGYPLDAVVLTTGCDKTTPACLMAVAALDIPAIVLSGGPMLNGWQRSSVDAKEHRIGSGTIIWKSREQHAAGEIDYQGFMDNLAGAAPSVGHCNTMGTALTMNCMAEALGMSLPGCAAIPAPHQARAQMAYRTGYRSVALALEDIRPSKIMTRAAFINALRVCSALGGSSNAPVHWLAIARQLGVSASIADWQEYGENIPLLVNCQPAGTYLGEDFYRAGGASALIGELLAAQLFDPDTLCVNGHTQGENYGQQRSQAAEVITSAAQPIQANAGFAVLSSNFFDSALLKKSVISDEFRQRYLSDPHQPGVFRARCVVFEGSEDYHRRIDDPSLNIDEKCILVIRNCGPVGYPGSAEVVNMLPPARLVKEGVRELPCLGDGRQSGTSASPSILNVAPEAAVGGGLSLLQSDDWLIVDLIQNRVDVDLSEEELRSRAEQSQAPGQHIPESQTPWQSIYRQKVSQLDDGAIFEVEEHHIGILQRNPVPRHSH